MNWLAFIFTNIERHVPRGGAIGWIAAAAVAIVGMLVILLVAT